MAHADCRCCMICDCSVGWYAQDCESKSDLCNSCAIDIYKATNKKHTAESFLEYLERLDNPLVINSVLILLPDYDKCFYPNKFDDLWERVKKELNDNQT